MESDEISKFAIFFSTPTGSMFDFYFLFDLGYQPKKGPKMG